MTRPKVPDDKRQRTAQACESCKRRKQKCNGQTPCNTCLKRNLTCGYESAASPTKRRQLGSLPSASSVTHDSPAQVPVQPANAETQAASAQATSAQAISAQATSVPALGPAWETKPPTPLAKIETPEAPAMPLQSLLVPDQRPSSILDRDFENNSRHSTGSGIDEEADIYNEKRMLQDKTGRLLYIGDPAPLSFLQFVRMLVESIAGRSPFTEDANRHRLMENIIEFPANYRPLCILPDRQTSDTLIESYFTNTCGFVEVFDKRAFIAEVEACYCDPLSAHKSFLCLFYLVLAIGLVLATPIPGSSEEGIIAHLRTAEIDRAESFYRSAKQMCDPVGGFEDADFWSIQALILMSIYMLAVSKRNAAYAHHGMAVRSAFALGLHRAETSNRLIFSDDQLWLRRTIWRTLHVLDRYLSASLGRPTAISEDDCSGDVLERPDISGIPSAYTAPGDITSIHRTGLDACVRSSILIGTILRRVYSKSKISTKVAHELAARDPTLDWKRMPLSNLHWSRLAEVNEPAHVMAILHVNLLQLHSTVLLTRPFFLYVITKCREQHQGESKPAPRMGSRLEKLAGSCVQASYHTVRLVQKVFEMKCLPQRNPFILHYFFAAILVVLTNEFFAMFRHDSYAETVTTAVHIMKYCAQSDPQAMRLVYILETFQEVVSRRHYSTTPGQYRSTMDISPTTNRSYDPYYYLAHHENSGIKSSGSSLSLSEPRFHNVTNMPRLESRGSPVGPGGRTIVDQDVPIPMPIPPMLEHMHPNSISPEVAAAHAFTAPSVVSAATSGVDLSDSHGDDVEFDMKGLWRVKGNGGSSSSVSPMTGPDGLFALDIQYQPQMTEAPMTRGFGGPTLHASVSGLPPPQPPPPPGAAVAATAVLGHAHLFNPSHFQ